MAVVELIDISKRFGSIEAVASFSLRIEQGEFVALLGPSGCGKTTTLNMLAGFLEPSGGDILIDGRSALGLPPFKRNIGLVFQSYALFPHMTVEENIAFGLKMRNVARVEAGSRVARALELVRLGGFGERYPRQLSGGQQQRVALARALVIEPSVLLLDEPLSNLDASLREQMRFEIRQIQRQIGITTVFVTHDQGEAMATADRLVVMNKGRVRQVGSVRDIYSRPADIFVAGFIGQANLVRGTVRALNGEVATIAVPTIGEISVPPRPDVKVGDEAAFLVRPEDTMIASTPPADGHYLTGRVARISDLGASLNVAVTVADYEFTIITTWRDQVPAVGAPAYIAWQPACATLIPVTEEP